MAKNEYTKERDGYAYSYHRVLGAGLYGLDMDLLIYSHKEDPIIPTLVGLFDFKKGSSDGTSKGVISLKYSAERAYLHTADRLDIQFYIVISYLDDSCPVKCYYVIPCNNKAKNFFTQIIRNGQPLSEKGAWFSLFSFSQLGHALRGLNFSPNEKINNHALKGVNLPQDMTLGQLPKEITQYPLPRIDL